MSVYMGRCGLSYSPESNGLGNSPSTTPWVEESGLHSFPEAAAQDEEPGAVTWT